MASLSLIPGVKGIIFAIISPKPYGFPSILVTSLVTPLAAIVPRVPICATDFSPYFFCTYSITLSLPSIQKSISKSGKEGLSGLRNRSNRSPCCKGSSVVIDKTYATREPAPEPLPGPTGIFCSLAHLTKSITIKKYPG